MIEAQSNYIASQARAMADMRRSKEGMERRIEGLEDQLDNTRAVDAERLRARDARIRQLEEDLAAANHTVDLVRAQPRHGDIADAFEELRGSVYLLFEDQNTELRVLEHAARLSTHDLVVMSVENSITELRELCAMDVHSVRMAVDRLEVLVQDGANTAGHGV